MKKASMDDYEPYEMFEVKCPVSSENIDEIIRRFGKNPEDSLFREADEDKVFFEEGQGHLHIKKGTKEKVETRVFLKERLTKIYTTYRAYEAMSGKPTCEQRNNAWVNIQAKAEAFLKSVRWETHCESLMDFSPALEMDLKKVATREKRSQLISSFNEIRGLAYFAGKICDTLKDEGSRDRSERHLPDDNWDWMLMEIKKLYVAIFNKKYGANDFIKSVLIKMGFSEKKVNGTSKRLERRKKPTK